MKTLLTFLSLLAALLFSSVPALSQGNAGTEFVFAMPPCQDLPGQNYVRIFISCPVETDVKLEAKGYTRTQKTIANGVIEFELSSTAAQVYAKNDQQEAPAEQIYPEAAIRITAGAPVICYAITRFDYTSDGFLALPVHALGKDYIVASYPDMTAMYSNLVLPSVTTVAAAYDSTIVRFTLGGNAQTRTSGGMFPGQIRQFTLNKGDVVAFASKGDDADLSGSHITATKPVAVTSGNQCANVPTTNRWCDYISEMELPVFTWGKEYHVTKIFGRKFNSVIRVFAKENNTQIFIDGQPFRLIEKGGGGKITETWLELRIPGDASNNVISADKPIYVVQYNTGQEEDNVKSDPFQLVLTPLEQYQQEITFHTPGIRGLHGFALNYINLVYELTKDNTIPDDLEFATVVNGKFQWRKLSAAFGGGIGGKFPVPVAGKPYACKTLILPGDGVYKIRSTMGSKFAAYAYGFSDYDSYGFPASLNIKNTLDPMAPVASFTRDCQGNIEGSVKDLPNVGNADTIRTNMAKVLLDQELSFNYTLSKEDFVAGESQTVKWKLSPIDILKPGRAVLHFADQAGNDTDTTIDYSPFLIKAKDLDFKIVKKGTSPEAVIHISNPATADIMIEDLTLESGSRFIFRDKPALPLIIKAMDSLAIAISFSTDTKGKYNDKLIVKGCSTIEAKITGEVGVPVIWATDIDFQQRPANTTTPLPVTVKNIGRVNLVISGYIKPAGPAFRIASPGTDGYLNWAFTPPIVLAPNTQAQFQVLFNPSQPGTFADSISFITDSDPQGSKHIVHLHGIVALSSVEDNSGGAVQFHISPNPAADFVNIELQNAEEFTGMIKILDALGAEIEVPGVHIQGSPTLRLETASLSPGIYFVRYSGESGTRTQSFIIMR